MVHSIAHEAKYLKGASITRDEVSNFVSFVERYDGNGEYVQGGVSKFIETAATKTITMKLRKTQGWSGVATDVQLDTSGLVA